MASLFIFKTTTLKNNALYQARKEFDIPYLADFAVLNGEKIVLLYSRSKQNERWERRIACRDSEMERLFEFKSIIRTAAV